MERKKSAKDIAFGKERAKFLSEIRRLSDLVSKQQQQIDGLSETVMEKDSVIRQQKDWIERLLEYTELSEEDMKKIIGKDKAESEVVEHLRSVAKVIGRFGFLQN